MSPAGPGATLLVNGKVLFTFEINIDEGQDLVVDLGLHQVRRLQ